MTARAALLLSVVLLLPAPGVVRAGGVNIAWASVCYTEAPVSLRTFPCNTNTVPASFLMTISFVIDEVMPDCVGVELAIDGFSDAPEVPDWWKLGPAPDCRAGRASFTANLAAVATESCLDWSGGAPMNDFEYTWETNRARLRAGAVIDASHPFRLEPGLEYYAGQVNILNGRTVGEGSCAGCWTGMGWLVSSIEVIALDGRRDLLDLPVPEGNQCLLWNFSLFPCGWVPARATTWGQVKSLYR